MTTTHRIRTWPLNPGRRYSSDDRLVWTLLPLSVVERIPTFENNFFARVHDWVGVGHTPAPRLSVDWLFFMEILSSLRSTSLEPEPTLGDRESHFNRENSASPDAPQVSELQADYNADLNSVGAVVDQLATAIPRALPNDGIMTPNTQSTITLSSSPRTHLQRSRSGSVASALSHATLSHLSHAIAMGIYSPLRDSSRPHTVNAGSRRTSVSEGDARTVTRPTTFTGSQFGQGTRETIGMPGQSTRSSTDLMSTIDEDHATSSNRPKRALSPGRDQDSSASELVDVPSHKRHKTAGDEPKGPEDSNEPLESAGPSN